MSGNINIEDLFAALEAIAQGYPVEARNDRFIIVENPNYRPDNGSNPKLVIDIGQLRIGGGRA